MRLKAVTIALFVVVLVMLVASPVLYQNLPNSSAPKELRRTYAVRTLDYLGVLLAAFVGAGVCSYFVYRQARREYEEESVRNLRSLLETPIKPPKPASEDEEVDGS